MWNRLGLTFVLAALTLTCIWLIAVPIGNYSAIRRKTFGDYLATFLGLIGLAIPNLLFALALLFIGFKYFDADSDALYRAIDEGWIAGAGLDAHEVEPLPPGDRFWTLRNTIITPHNGATTLQTSERGYAIFGENLARYVRNEPLVNIVQKTLGY